MSLSHCSRQTVDLRSIDWNDLRFSILSYLPAGQLEGSLQRSGMLFLPWVWDTGSGRHVIVDGFKRLEWARSSGAESVECIVFPENVARVPPMLLRVETKLFGPPLNTAEKAQLVAKLAQCLPAEIIAADYLPALNLRSRPEVVVAWCMLADAGKELLQAAAAGEVSERAALVLAVWDKEAKERAVEIFRDLRCSASIQMEMLDRAAEIARREGIGRLQVLNDTELVEVLQDGERNRRQKIQAMRELLGRRRFPKLWEREQRFAAELERADLPSRVRLVPPPSFEGNQWQMLLTFSSPEELRELLESSGTFEVSNRIEEMMSRETGVRSR